jgi:ketosteroid isomerase-like protein
LATGVDLKRSKEAVVSQQTEHRSFQDAYMDSSPVAVVEAFGAAWAAHDLEATLALITDDCVFEATGPAPDGVRHVGLPAIRAVWQAIFDDTDSKFEEEETFVADDRVVQRWLYSWDGGHVRGVDLFKVRDGKVAEKLSYVKG